MVSRRIRPYCLWLLLACFAFALPVNSQIRISEFLAQNDGLTRDRDGDSPDWIELHNSSPAAVSLAGWRLTDAATNLTKWTFPAVSIPANGYLLVFASGKNRSVAGAELHASFQLEDSGGFLALVDAGGAIVHSYDYASQRANVSFGIAGSSGTVMPLIASGATARYLVPADGTIGSAWTGAGFNDSSWNSGATGLGFSGTTGLTLRVDFNERVVDAVANTMPGFSPFVINSNVATIAIQTNPTTRVFGNVLVTLSNTAPVGYDDRLRTTPVNNGAFTESLLLRDFVFSRSADNGGLDLAIENLLPNQPYSITIWSFDSGSPGTRVSDWFANGVLVRENYTFTTNAPTSNDQYRFTFDATADANGRILVSGRRDSASVGSTGAPDFGVFLNAFELTGGGAGAATDVSAAMRDQNASIFVRMPFAVTDPASVQQLRLRMKYDDGFVAYINGQQIAARNAPASPLWNSAASAEHPNEQAAVFEEIIINVPPGLLTAAQNVLAIHGLNLSASDPDFLILPELEAIRSAADDLRYFRPPTPGVANGAGFLGLVSDTKFSVDRGFYDTPFSVVLTCDTPGATIYWTTNGSAPSPTNGQVYSTPVAIGGTAILRAAAYLTNHIPSDVDTHSYIFLAQVLRQSATQPGYPTTWQASYPADYGMDSNVVNHPVYGLTISNDLRSIPTLSIVSDHNGMWSSATGIYPNSTSSGAAWERAASAELIDGDGSTEFAINCKIEMHGNASRDNVRTPKHSMRLSFNSDFGPTKLRYDWFDGGVETHDGIVLRSCGFVDGWAGRYADQNIYTSSETGETFRGLRYRPENTCYLRDVWMKDSFRDMGSTASRSAFVHLYINGLYWGLYEPSERLNASYFSEHHGGPEGAWDVIVGDDSGGPPVVVDGAVADWQAVLNLVNAGVTSEAAYQAIAQRVDIDNLIDYMMLHIFAESEDWPHHNWYVAHRRATNGLPATKFVCTVWDQELTLDRLVRRNRISVGSSGGEVYGPGRVYQQLRAWPEFRRQFGDRVHQHLFNAGALTPSNNVVRLLAKAAVIRDAVVGESARWGDARKFPTPGNVNGTGQTFTRDEWWQPEIDKLATNFFQKLTADNIARFRAGTLYPSLHAPAFSQFGGAVPSGFQLGMTHSNTAGTIFFTTDGSDPRTYGTGAVAPGAQAFSAPVPLNAPTRVRARVFNSGQWSAIVDATFFPPQDLSSLALTEIMYNPPALGSFEGDDLEFVELKNRGANTLNLSGLVLGGVSFTFTNGTRLAPGEFFVLARNATAFATKYPGVVVNGIYSGRLDNGGEALRISFPFGGNIFSVTYDDDVPWPLAPDNFGYSIVPKASVTTQAPDNGASWRASSQPAGSPGADDPEPAVAPIVINEVLTASTPPQEDWIELFNPTANPVDISGWFLSDDANAPTKFRIPNGTTIDAGGYATFTEAQFNPAPGAVTSFSLSSQGEQIYLFSGDVNTNLTGYSHGFTFDAAAPGISFGRYVNSVGEEHFPAQTTTSSNRLNFGPRIGPIVINEIHYHPTNGGDEFIELRNISPSGVAFYDPAYPSNTWRIAGLDYTFPTGFAMTNGYCLIVGTNPAAFRAKYSVPQSVAILGPWAGSLQDSGERLRLQRPGTPDTNGFGYITVDEVRYNDKAPWPAAADGTGASLQRIVAMAYANDPTNWLAALPTPGRTNGAGDSDFDGMPDDWELANGTDPTQNDAHLDPDGDGRSNLEEYIAGTDPLNAGSVFEIVIRLAPNSSLSFESAAGRVYTVQTAATLPGSWTTVGSEMAGTGSTLTVPINVNQSARFYRVLVQDQ